MKISRALFVIALVIVGVWALSLAVKLVAWFVNSLLYIAAVIVIIGIVRAWWENRKNAPDDKESDSHQ